MENDLSSLELEKARTCSQHCCVINVKLKTLEAI